MTTHRIHEPWTCTTCQIGIPHRPTFHLGLAFCCAGCVAGGPCGCTYDEEDRHDDQPGVSDDRAHVADDTRGLVGAGR